VTVAANLVRLYTIIANLNVFQRGATLPNPVRGVSNSDHAVPTAALCSLKEHSHKATWSLLYPHERIVSIDNRHWNIVSIARCSYQSNFSALSEVRAFKMHSTKLSYLYTWPSVHFPYARKQTREMTTD
jgi:hypothetical protein